MTGTSQHDDPNTAVEALLRSSTPLPDEIFVSRLESMLFPAARPSLRSRIAPRGRLFLAGGATASALAAGVFALSLAGFGPFDQGDNGASRARTRCAFTPVKKTVKVPRIVTGPDNAPALRYERRVVTRSVKRCH